MLRQRCQPPPTRRWCQGLDCFIAEKDKGEAGQGSEQQLEVEGRNTKVDTPKPKAARRSRGGNQAVPVRKITENPPL